MRFFDKCIENGLLPIGIFLVGIWGMICAIFNTCAELISLLWNSRILKFSALKSSLDELRKIALERENQILLMLKEQKELEIDKLTQRADFGDDNKLYNGALYIALKDALIVFSVNMKIKMNAKTAEILKNSKLWNSFLAEHEQNALNAFEIEFSKNAQKALEIVKKTHDFREARKYKIKA